MTASNTLKMVAIRGNTCSNQAGHYGSTKRVPATSSYAAGPSYLSKSTKKA